MASRLTRFPSAVLFKVDVFALESCGGAPAASELGNTLCSVTHVPGQICYLCTRSVPGRRRTTRFNGPGLSLLAPAAERERSAHQRRHRDAWRAHRRDRHRQRHRTTRGERPAMWMREAIRHGRAIEPRTLGAGSLRHDHRDPSEHQSTTPRRPAAQLSAGVDQLSNRRRGRGWREHREPRQGPELHASAVRRARVRSPSGR